MSDALAPVVSFSLDRTWRGPLAVGGRAWTALGSGFVDDGDTLDAVGVEGFVVARTGDRFLDLRGAVGLGVSALDYSFGGFGCEVYDEAPCSDPRGVEGIRPYVLGAVGLDLYPLAGVGVGADVRPAGMAGPANLPSAEVGLRVRLAR